MAEESPRVKALSAFLLASPHDSDRKWAEYVALAPDLAGFKPDTTVDDLSPGARRCYDYLVGASTNLDPARDVLDMGAADLAASAHTTCSSECPSHNADVPASELAALVVCDDDLTSAAPSKCNSTTEQLDSSSTPIPAVADSGATMLAPNAGTAMVREDDQHIEAPSCTFGWSQPTVLPTATTSIKPSASVTNATMLSTVFGTTLDASAAHAMELLMGSYCSDLISMEEPSNCSQCVHLQLYHSHDRANLSGKLFLFPEGAQVDEKSLGYSIHCSSQTIQWEIAWTWSCALEVREVRQQFEVIIVVQLEPPWPPPLGTCMTLPMGKAITACHSCALIVVWLALVELQLKKLTFSKFPAMLGNLVLLSTAATQFNMVQYWEKSQPTYAPDCVVSAVYLSFSSLGMVVIFSPGLYEGQATKIIMTFEILFRGNDFLEFCSTPELVSVLPAGTASLYGYVVAQLQWEIAWPTATLAYFIHYSMYLYITLRCSIVICYLETELKWFAIRSNYVLHLHLHWDPGGLTRHRLGVKPKFMEIAWLLVGSYWASSESERSGIVTLGDLSLWRYPMPLVNPMMLNVYHTYSPRNPIEAGLQNGVLLQDWLLCFNGNIIQSAFEDNQWKIAWSFYVQPSSGGNKFAPLSYANTLQGSLSANCMKLCANGRPLSEEDSSGNSFVFLPRDKTQLLLWPPPPSMHVFVPAREKNPCLHSWLELLLFEHIYSLEALFDCRITGTCLKHTYIDSSGCWEVILASALLLGFRCQSSSEYFDSPCVITREHTVNSLAHHYQEGFFVVICITHNALALIIGWQSRSMGCSTWLKEIRPNQLLERDPGNVLAQHLLNVTRPQTPIPVSQPVDMSSSYVLVPGKEFHTMWDPGGYNLGLFDYSSEHILLSMAINKGICEQFLSKILWSMDLECYDVNQPNVHQTRQLIPAIALTFPHGMHLHFSLQSYFVLSYLEIEIRSLNVNFIPLLHLPWDPGGLNRHRLEDKPNFMGRGLSATFSTCCWAG